jgi:hypothetical protein
MRNIVVVLVALLCISSCFAFKDSLDFTEVRAIGQSIKMRVDDNGKLVKADILSLSKLVHTMNNEMKALNVLVKTNMKSVRGPRDELMSKIRNELHELKTVMATMKNDIYKHMTRVKSAMGTGNPRYMEDIRIELKKLIQLTNSGNHESSNVHKSVTSIISKFTRIEKQIIQNRMSILKSLSRIAPLKNHPIKMNVILDHPEPKKKKDDHKKHHKHEEIMKRKAELIAKIRTELDKQKPNQGGLDPVMKANIEKYVHTMEKINHSQK